MGAGHVLANDLLGIFQERLEFDGHAEGAPSVGGGAGVRVNDARCHEQALASGGQFERELGVDDPRAGRT